MRSAAKVRFVTDRLRAVPRSPDFSGNRGEISAKLLSGPGKAVRMIRVGLGKDPTRDDLRVAAHAASTYLRKTKTSHADIIEPKDVKFRRVSSYPLNAFKKELPLARSLAEWLHTSHYQFEKLSSRKPHVATVMKINTKSDADSKHAKAGQVIAEAINFARDLGNLRPDVCTPAFMAREAVKLCSPRGFRLRHNLDQRALQRRGLNLLHAVGKGSPRPPRLVVLEYIGNPKSKETTALIGKGITMDTGGLNVKPFGSMETMHMDMMGAAAVLGAARAIKDLKLPVNVVVALALAENAIGHQSYLPSTVIKSLKGTTVEILNTDAEGRLALADAFTFVQDHANVRKVTKIVDLATLTGACVAALGEERAGLFSNDADLASSICEAGEETMERVWPLPIDADHESKMKGELSDLVNVAQGRYAGASTAAAFLKHFVNDGVKWVHLDIAGPGIGTKATKTRPAGAPGFGVSLLVRFLEGIAETATPKRKGSVRRTTRRR